MKKITFFLAIAIAATSLVSCSESNTKTNNKVAEYTPEIPPLYYAGSDTSATEVHDSFQKKGYTKTVCATGEKVKGSYWKLVGKDTVRFSTTKQGAEVPRDSIELWFKGTTKVVTTEPVQVDNGDESSSSNTGSTSSSSNAGGMPGWLADLFYILLAIILIALAVWGLWWLFKQIPQRNNNNSSSQKTNFMTTNAANPNRIDQFNTMLATLKGTSGEGKGMVKDTKEGYEVVVGEVKTTPAVTVTNSSNVNIYFGSATLTDSNNNGAEPKKNEPAAAAAQ